MTLRWRIALTFMFLTAAVLAVVGAGFRSAILRQTTETARERLLAEARLVAAEAPPAPWERSAATEAWSKEMGERLGVRVTLIDGDGAVAADSEHDPATMENHGNRAERLEAVKTGWGSSVHRSATLGIDMLYVAVPVGPAKPTAPVVRLALPLKAVEAASREARRSMLLVLLVMAGVVAVSLPWISGTLTEPVERLLAAARRVARGDLEARVTGPARGEMAELTEVFNDAVDRLAGLLESSREEAGRYAAILEQMSDAVVIVDRHGRVGLVNSAFAQVFGADREQIAGKYLEQIALNYELGQLLSRALRQGSVQRGDVRVLHPETRTLAGVASPLLDEDGEVTGAVGLLHDVTDLYRLDRVRRDFVSNASHELRTPTAGIRALAEALEGGALEDPVKGPEFVQGIVEASDRLTAILDDMLVLTRVERGQDLLKPERVNVLQACQRAMAYVERRAEEQGIDLGCTVAAEDRVWADPGTLQTILTNLLDNAVKCTPSGGRVEVRGSLVPEGYEIAVSDTGVGIPEEDRERIFERFYRVDKARDRATGGTGLGLSIVKHSVEAHRGRVTVQSEVGKGSTFRVTLPEPKRD